MKLTRDQTESLKQAAQPLIDWMNDNCHPQCEAHVDQTSVEIVESVAKVYAPDCHPHPATPTQKPPLSATMDA